MEEMRCLTDRFAGDRSGGSGYGYGDGSGYGSDGGSGSGSDGGYGDGSGNGSGYGSDGGYGDGSGYGSDGGYGYGSIFGSGYGYGYGSGNGSDGGSGYCYGDGSGISEYNGRKMYMIDGIATIIDRVHRTHGSVAKGRILKNDLTTVPCYIVKQDGLFAHGKTIHEAMNALREKLFENMPEEDRIAEFVKAHAWGEKYSSKDFYDWHHRLTGSCEMGRREFAESHGYNLTEEELLTVEEFVELTKNSYGSSIIRKLRAAYGGSAG